MAEETNTKKPESVILEWTADRLHYIADRVFLNTGINEVSAAFWEANRWAVADLIHDPKKPLTDAVRKEGRILEKDVVVEIETDGRKKSAGAVTIKSAKGLKEMEPADAELLIADTWVVSTLEKWKKDSGDETIRRACMNQIDKIMATKGKE